jgi:hypothetical protein
MPKLLQPKTLKKQKSLKELHKEATKDLEYIELPLHDTPNPNFVSETYEEWLEEMEYEESLLTPEQKEEAKKREQKFWKLMKQLHPDKFKEVNL